RPGQPRPAGSGTGPARPAGQSAGPGGARTGGGPRPGGGPNRPRPQGGGGRHTKGRRHFSKSAPKEENSESEIEVEGTICAVLAGTMFKVRLPNGHEVLAHISGKMRKRFIKIVVGDKVRMEMSPYDMTKARITFRIG
ncbi:translation initiation factor IF-1, partial [Akkermansia sp.]